MGWGGLLGLFLGLVLLGLKLSDGGLDNALLMGGELTSMLNSFNILGGPFSEENAERSDGLIMLDEASWGQVDLTRLNLAL